MNKQPQKIEFYKKRGVSDILSASMEFFKQNFLLLLKVSACILLPINILQAFFANNTLMALFDPLSYEYDANYFLGVGLNLVSYCVMTGVIYTILLYYNKRDTLEGITLTEMLNDIRRNSLKAFTLTLLFLLLIALFTFLGAILVAAAYTVNPAAGILIAFFLILCLFLLIFTVQVYPLRILENTGIMDSFSTSIRLGIKNIGKLLGTVLLIGLLTAVCQGVFSIPTIIIMVTRYILGIADSSSLTGITGLSILQYLSVVLLQFGSIFFAMFTMTGIAYYHSSVCDQAETLTTTHIVDNFENL